MASRENELALLLVKSFFPKKMLDEATDNFERRFTLSGLRDLPEYQNAVDALKNYGDSVAKHYLEEVKRRNGGK